MRAAGFEVGIHAFDRVKWHNRAAHADAAWTAREMQLALTRFSEIFNEQAKTHGAAGWQMNVHALRLTQRLGFDYCSDFRGRAPFIPVARAEIISCPQLPTTLPTLDELIGRNGLHRANLAQHVLDLTRTVTPTGHVFALHAELEGLRLAAVFEQLLTGWKAQGYELTSLAYYRADFVYDRLPRCEVAAGSVPGRWGTLCLQGNEFLAPGAAPLMLSKDA